jgi:hypothetical protein
VPRWRASCRCRYGDAWIRLGFSARNGRGVRSHAPSLQDVTAGAMSSSRTAAQPDARRRRIIWRRYGPPLVHRQPPDTMRVTDDWQMSSSRAQHLSRLSPFSGDQNRATAAAAHDGRRSKARPRHPQVKERVMPSASIALIRPDTWAGHGIRRWAGFPPGRGCWQRLNAGLLRHA